jgi:hypothetical protein
MICTRKVVLSSHLLRRLFQDVGSFARHKFCLLTWIRGKETELEVSSTKGEESKVSFKDQFEQARREEIVYSSSSTRRLSLEQTESRIFLRQIFGILLDVFIR